MVFPRSGIILTIHEDLLHRPGQCAGGGRQSLLTCQSATLCPRKKRKTNGVSEPLVLRKGQRAPLAPSVRVAGVAASPLVGLPRGDQRLLALQQNREVVMVAPRQAAGGVLLPWPGAAKGGGDFGRAVGLLLPQPALMKPLAGFHRGQATQIASCSLPCSLARGLGQLRLLCTPSLPRPGAAEGGWISTTFTFASATCDSPTVHRWSKSQENGEVSRSSPHVSLQPGPAWGGGTKSAKKRKLQSPPWRRGGCGHQPPHTSQRSQGESGATH